MGSFYGMGGSGSSGGSNSNYDKMLNTPITNVGTKTLGNFTILSSLEEKHYNVIGYYKIDSNDSIHNAKTPLDVLIYKDSNTDNKVIQFFTSEDGTIYLNTFVYNENGQRVKSNKIDLT